MHCVCSNFDSCAILNSQAPKIFLSIKNNVDFLGNSEVAFFFYTPCIDIVIALLNTVCFVNISIPKAKGKHICEEFKFVHESIMTLRDL